MNNVFFSQEAPPGGYDPAVYGPWPLDGCWVIKVRCPPSWKSTRDPSNFHTVTVLLAHRRDPSMNPLLMGQGLEQIQDWHCTCKSGLRTAASCTHRCAGLLLTCASECFNTAKVPEAVMVDTARLLFHIYTSIDSFYPDQMTINPSILDLLLLTQGETKIRCSKCHHVPSQLPRILG